MRHRAQSGFTLVEVVITLTILAIVTVIAATFIQAPMQGYFVAARRAELTDVADGATRRMARDLRQALPNSIRILNGTAIEFLSVRQVGRYRAALGVPGDDLLDFTQPDASFDILGPPMQFQANDQIVIYNLGPNGPDADAYSGSNRRAYGGDTGAPLTKVRLASAEAFPLDAPSHRFFVVDTPVTYRCEQGVLLRYWNYPIGQTQSDPPGGGLSAKLAEQNVRCNFVYEPGLTARLGLVSIELALTLAGETVTMYQEIHVANTP